MTKSTIVEYESESRSIILRPSLTIAWSESRETQSSLFKCTQPVCRHKKYREKERNWLNKYITCIVSHRTVLSLSFIHMSCIIIISIIIVIIKIAIIIDISIVNGDFSSCLRLGDRMMVVAGDRIE